jgi:hypothetical protein
MRKSVNKDNSSKEELLGQYNTKREGTDLVVSSIVMDKETLFIEPSFGTGNFIQSIRGRFKDSKILGIEIDKEVYDKFNFEGVELLNMNFYDFKEIESKEFEKVFFVGNPPYRTPALSLTDRPKEIKRLKKKYSITGVKEECVFFIMKTFDLILNTGKPGEIIYILPKTIFENPTKAFESFYKFIKDKIVSIEDISIDYFENVSQDLVVARFSTEHNKETFKYNGDEVISSEFLGGETDSIPYMDIFKKTYLGSVPAESFLLSCEGESKECFYERLNRIFFEETNNENIIEKLSYNGSYHLSNIDDKKKAIILNYINEIKEGFNLEIFKDISNYKPIKHRTSTRFYFRHESLKKVSFVYIINSKPCESFYFTCNPTKISTDYYGFTEYDANRNSSPGGIRTVPVEGLEENLTETFKNHWQKNTTLGFERVFDYLIHVYQSDWYKLKKKKYGKFYFGVPLDFLKDFR